MASLKNLLGSNPKDREFAEEMRAVLQEMHQERARFEALLNSAESSAERLQEVREPIARAASDVDAVAQRLAEVEQRFASMAQVSDQLQSVAQRSESLLQNHQQAQTEIASTLEETQRIRALFEDLGQKVDTAVELKERLGAFLEVEQPFQHVRNEAEAVREQVENTVEHLARLREQQDRLTDAHKLAMSKMEALDRRRDDLGRSLQDKERRVASVEMAVRGMDGVQHTVDDVRRDIGTLKALGDTVAQKAAALEVQREAVERALAQADHLDRSMRQIDSGLRQQQENEKALNTLQDSVAALRSLHEAVIDRSGEISQLQRETEERIQATRQELASVTDEMRKTVERFDFESRGLESVSQRVADLRGALSDCENRFKGLNEASLAMGELKTQQKALGSTFQTLSEEVGQVDQEMAKFRATRRDLDETGRSVRELSTQVQQIEGARVVVEAACHDLEQLRAAHATVRDTLEQTQLAHAEIARMRESESETRSWLTAVEQSLADLRDQVGEVQRMSPTVEAVQKQTQRLSDSMTTIESRREFIEGLHGRMTYLESLGGKLDDRARQLQTHMEGAEQRFLGLAASAEETERLTTSIAAVSSSLNEAGRKTAEIVKTVAAIASRCESVEQLAEKTRALKPELDQRHHALTEATKDLQRASALRKEAAGFAQKLDEQVKKLTGALTTADQHVAQVGELSTELEARASNLRTVEKRLGPFEERLAKWDPVGKEIARSLEQISARQGTVEALQADLERMFALAEKTATDVREIASAQQEIEQSRNLLNDVMARLREVQDTTKQLDERKRQMTKAEERLSRAEALLVDVRSSLEALQGQKAIVDQAVEKAGSLQFLLKQADATIEGLREEREMTARVRAAVSGGRQEDEDEDDQQKARAA